MLIERYNEVKKHVEEACKRVGRDPREVTVIAVSKTKPVDMLMDVYRAGARDFGENKVQELVDKIPQMPSDVRWHMIGHLQTNKIKYVIDRVVLIHSIDSIHLAEAVNAEAKKHNRIMPVLVEVNVAQEESKSGFTKEEAAALAARMREFPHVALKGLMAIPPVSEFPGENCRYFAEMRNLFVDISAKKYDNVSMDCLSMGMSGDYPDAIREGATLVRVGTAIFGARNYNKV